MSILLRLIPAARWCCDNLVRYCARPKKRIRAMTVGLSAARLICHLEKQTSRVSNLPKQPHGFAHDDAVPAECCTSADGPFHLVSMPAPTRRDP